MWAITPSYGYILGEVQEHGCSLSPLRRRGVMDLLMPHGGEFWLQAGACEAPQCGSQQAEMVSAVGRAAIPLSHVGLICLDAVLNF